MITEEVFHFKENRGEIGWEEGRYITELIIIWISQNKKIAVSARHREI